MSTPQPKVARVGNLGAMLMLVWFTVSCGARIAGRPVHGSDLVGAYRFTEHTLGAGESSEFLVLDADGSFYQFFGSTLRHKGFCNAGRWRVSASGSDHIDLNNLMRWEEDENGTGRIFSDHLITFRAPLEIKHGRIRIVLNDDLDRGFERLQ